MSLIRYTFNESYAEANMALPSGSREPMAQVQQRVDTEPVSVPSYVMEWTHNHKVYVALLLVLLCAAGVAVASTLDINALGWMFHMGWMR